MDHLVQIPLSANTRLSALGHLSGDIEVLVEQEFRYVTFNMFLRHIYGDKVIVEACSSYENLFQLLQMSKLYLMDKLSDIVVKKISALNISMDSLLSSLETAGAYKNLDGFEHICSNVEKKVQATFCNQSSVYQYSFYKQHRLDNPRLVFALIDMMTDAKLSATAPNSILNGVKLHVAVKTKVMKTAAVKLVEPPRPQPIGHVVKFTKFYQLYKDNKEKNPELVNALIDLMPDFVIDESDSAQKEDVVCSNCLVPPTKCKNGQKINAVPHVGMRYLEVGRSAEASCKVHVALAYPNFHNALPGEVFITPKHTDEAKYGRGIARQWKYPNEASTVNYQCWF